MLLNGVIFIGRNVETGSIRKKRLKIKERERERVVRGKERGRDVYAYGLLREPKMYLNVFWLIKLER